MTKTIEKKTEEILHITTTEDVVTVQEVRKSELEAEEIKLNERLVEIKDLLKEFK